MSDDQSPLTIPTPGAYLRARRWVAGLSIDEVAARIRTDPRLGELDRIQWLRSIEADVVPPSFSTIVALNMVFSFDLNALALLDAIARGQLSPREAPALCPLCGKQQGQTQWSARDRCPVCVTFSAPCGPIGTAA